MGDSARRREILAFIGDRQGQTLSKVLNTQGISLQDLRLTVKANFDFDAAFRRSGDTDL